MVIEQDIKQLMKNVKSPTARQYTRVLAQMQALPVVEDLFCKAINSTRRIDESLRASGTMASDVIVLQDFLFSSRSLRDDPSRSSMTDLSGNALFANASPVIMHRMGLERLDAKLQEGFTDFKNITTFVLMCVDDERKKKTCADEKPVADDEVDDEEIEEEEETVT